ncbi:MAG: tRNA-dihydrouridine synthase family protein [Pseudomonadota bacterium]
MSPFKKLGIPENPILLAPLAGVSDHPFRRICEAQGADLTYVEMLSAAAIVFKSKRTLEMCERHGSEKKLGVQVTARSASEMGEAVSFLDSLNFDTIDINMGCPVKKVVKSGCGSAILRDPERVYQTTLAARKNTKLPLSVKIRLGWSQEELTFKEVVSAAEQAGADWITVHGRTRNDDYSAPIDLEKMAQIVDMLSIPVIGNGNIFSKDDADIMISKTGCSGVMVSRGALGNPWLFRSLKEGNFPVKIDDWLGVVLQHMTWHREAYGDSSASAVCMRKHLLWYISGWPGARKLRDEIVRFHSWTLAEELLLKFVDDLKLQGVGERTPIHYENENRFVWDPKFDMDRKLDRGVSGDGIDTV